MSYAPSFLNTWLDSWAPGGLAGARPNTSSPDVLHKVHRLLDAAVTGHSSPLEVISLDQSQCFDRLFQDTLADISRILNLDVCLAAVGIYAQMARILFIDGQSTNT